MGFMESVKTCLSKYIDFSGRASRSEYWWFCLFTLIANILTAWIPILFVGWIVALALMPPLWSVMARRLHDINRTGWWMLLPIGVMLAGVILGTVFVIIAFVDSIDANIYPGSLSAWLIVAGYLVLLLFLIQSSDPHANRYGPGPDRRRSPYPGSDTDEPGNLV